VHRFAYVAALSPTLFAGCDRPDRADGVTPRPLEYRTATGDDPGGMNGPRRIVRERGEIFSRCNGCTGDPGARIAKVDAAVEAGRTVELAGGEEKGHAPHHGHEAHEHRHH